ncbi:medium-chain acyl-CoA ligase ACSF2, mitochondrial-like [Anneissia japonica]|uniref:medium-chain acyl-CoA ligase ACSF2, mitochondrial-like n=1 Tax=Anneissia japonica TaxID=1529436 RepID=UPI0014255E12|nr:medium-chain acyl-CoA ligase ACSF2, mitochondrial-like [Anneissia japonica]
MNLIPAYHPKRTLKSASKNLFVVQKFRTQAYGSCLFSVASSQLWNNYVTKPEHIHTLSHYEAREWSDFGREKKSCYRDVQELNQDSGIRNGAYDINGIEKLGSDPKVVELFKLKKDEVIFDDDSDIFITSGSTGKPKYVVHTHFSVINGAKGMFYYLEGMPNKENRRILGLNTSHISGEGSGVLPPLVASMTSVFAPTMYNIKQIVQAIQNERCTDVLFLISFLYDMLNFKDIGEYDVTSLDICT